MNIEKRINAFVALGKEIKTSEIIADAIQKSTIKNPWFTTENIQYAIDSIADTLSQSSLTSWVSKYNFTANEPRTIAVIMAGNIPLVGFNDFLCVLMSGNNIVCKLSSSDDILLPAAAKVLTDIEPEFGKRIIFSNEKLKDFDAIIATGSNNTQRYFEFYFGKYPHIIRHNRNSIAVLSGNETTEELLGLCDDIFLHFGLGCRSINKLYVPKNYNFNALIEAGKKYSHLFDHHIYKSNLDYHKALLMLNGVKFVDGNFWALKEDISMHSPVSIVNYEYYETTNDIELFIKQNTDNIQCVVGKNITNCIPFGHTQKPTLTDYADGVDTMQWLSTL